MEVTYTILRSSRRTIAIQVKDGKVLVRAPYRLGKDIIAKFVSEKQGWIQKQLNKQAENTLPPFTKEALQELSREAARVLPARTALLAKQMGVTYNRVTIRFQKTRWGSCSTKGNLNFNGLLMLAPKAVQDYVILHELCHRKEMNHGSIFWALVEQHMPDYRQCKAWLKTEGSRLIQRLGI